MSFYEESIKRLQAIEDGSYHSVSYAGKEQTPAVQTRKGTGVLKDDIVTCFKEAPNRVRSPKEVSDWLVANRNWSDDKNLRSRVSNLLRKIVKDDLENWLDKAGHGRYRLRAEA